MLLYYESQSAPLVVVFLQEHERRSGMSGFNRGNGFTIDRENGKFDHDCFLTFASAASISGSTQVSTYRRI